MPAARFRAYAHRHLGERDACPLARSRAVLYSRPSSVRASATAAGAAGKGGTLAQHKEADRLRASLRSARVFGLSFPVVRQLSATELARLDLVLRAERTERRLGVAVPA